MSQVDPTAHSGLRGPRLGFITGWAIAYTYVAVCVFEAISIGWILGEILPWIEGPVLYTLFGADVRAGTLVLATGFTVLLTWLHYHGTDLAARVQDVMTVILMAARRRAPSSGVPPSSRPHSCSASASRSPSSRAPSRTCPCHGLPSACGSSWARSRGRRVTGPDGEPGASRAGRPRKQRPRREAGVVVRCSESSATCGS